MIYILPKTKLGKWSVWLIVAFFMLLATLQLLVASGQQGPGFNPILAAAIIPAGLAGVLAFITGIVSIVKNKERSLIIFLTTLIGLLILLFIVGEFTSPH